MIFYSFFSVLPTTAATTHAPTPTTTTSTTTLAPPDPTFGCDFEHGTPCDWMIEQGGELTEFTISAANNSIGSILPHADHTLHNCKFR